MSDTYFVARLDNVMVEPVLTEDESTAAEAAAHEYDLPVSALDIEGWTPRFDESIVEETGEGRIWVYEHASRVYSIHEVEVR